MELSFSRHQPRALKPPSPSVKPPLASQLCCRAAVLSSAVTHLLCLKTERDTHWSMIGGSANMKSVWDVRLKPVCVGSSVPGGAPGGLCSVYSVQGSGQARPPQSSTGPQPGRCQYLLFIWALTVLQCYTLGDDSSKYLVGMAIPQNTLQGLSFLEGNYFSVSFSVKSSQAQSSSVKL